MSIGVGRTGLHIVTAIDERTGETFIVRGVDLFATTCEVARQAGIRLDDAAEGVCPKSWTKGQNDD